MTTWRDAPDASGLWWVRHEGQPDDVLRVDIDADGVWINRGGEGWCSAAEYVGAQWCRVVTPERVEALDLAAAVTATLAQEGVVRAAEALGVHRDTLHAWRAPGGWLHAAREE